MAAATALRDFGEVAEPSLTALEALTQHDPEDRVQEAARNTIKRIREKSAASSEITKLKDELERLKRTQDALRERLDKYEKVERNGS
jgi:predicted RNase H-like nuclease (RuvC/YqgF family)